jgi:8-oxo-dGTP pyrophosphatase MutT (NUDIX family)
MDDPRMTSVGETYKGPFWTLIGGRIEHDETVLQAAAREIFEETGICKPEIQFGPVVWFEELDLVTRDGPIRLKQKFVVGRTNASTLTLAHLTEDEPEVVKQIAWFSLEEVRTSTERIYPVLLALHLPRIIAGDYPEQPLDVSKAPEEQPL